MEGPPAPECPAADRSDDVRDSVRDDIRLDGEWKRQRVREGTPGYRSVEAGRFSLNLSPASVQFH